MSNYEANPIGALQQRFQSSGIKLTYREEHAESSCASNFAVQVTYGDFTCSGLGYTKKQAKNNAARSMLDKLDKISGSKGSQFLPNIVGALQEMCMKQGLPMPIYKMQQDGHSQHNQRIFVIMCTVGKFKEIGQGGTKKDAKRKAAQIMFDKLKGIGSGTENSVADNTSEKEIIFDELGRLSCQSGLSIFHFVFRCKEISEIIKGT